MLIFGAVRVPPQPQAPALKDCVIVALHLGNNALGDKGLTSLADGLRHARGLQKLHLNDNEVRCGRQHLGHVDGYICHKPRYAGLALNKDIVGHERYTAMSFAL